VADHTAVRRHVGLLGHAAPLYDELSAAENVRFAVRALGLPAATGDRPSSAWAWSGASAPPRPAASRPGSDAGWPWPRWWPAARPSGCSMSRTPASMPPRAPSSGELIGEAVADGAAVLLSSHEPELSVPSPTGS
jgi:hypothetical protein